MTLLETERLVRKINEILQNGGGSDFASKIAGDFAAICHTTGLRLQQCEAMIKAGDRHQAIQLAETPPSLLDLVTVLEFRNADEWRSYCQNNALPVASRIDGRAVQELNNCYAQGIATDHPLYAAYRKAVLGRNDEEALKSLQSITRLNPNDSNGASELTRLDAKVLSLKIENLGMLISGGDTASVVAAIEAIESFGFKAKPEGEIWRKAEVIRCVDLLEKAVNQRANSQWVEVLSKLDFIKRLQREFALELSGSVLKTMGELEAWGRGESEKDKRDKEFKGLISELRHRIQKSEEKDTAARYVELPEMKQDSEALHKVWRALPDFARPIPEDLTGAFKKRIGLIDAEIARRTAIRLRIILATVAAVVVVVGLIIWFTTDRMRASDFERQLRSAVSEKQVHAAARLIDRLKTSDKGLLNVSSVNTAMAAAESLISEQNALLSNFNIEFSKLPTKFNGEPDATQINTIADQLTKVRSALETLAPDLKQENEPKLKAFEQQWQQYLSQSGSIVNGILEQWVTEGEAISDQLDYRTSIETAAAQLGKLLVDIQKINDLETGFKGQMTVRNDLIQRANGVRSKYVAYDRELKKIDEGLAAMKKAASFQEYSLGVSNIASSEYSSASAVVEAIAVNSLRLNEQTVLRALLNATNPATWAFINKNFSLDFIPEMSMPAEQIAFKQIFSDPSINAAHQHLRLYLDQDKNTVVDWITAGALDTSEGWNKISAWTVSPNASKAIFDDHDYGHFSGQMKLTPTQPVFRIENLIETDGAAAFGKVGLIEMYKTDGKYSGSLLSVLDSIVSSREGSPVFRAQLYCLLVNIMGYQPDAWGLSFCPSIKTTVAKIHSVAGGAIDSGDWLITQKATKWGPKLDQIFGEEKSVSYLNQAKTYLAIAQAVSKDGLKYVGFVGVDGKPVLAQETAPVEMWCYSSSAKGIVLYSGSAMPLSPLFALQSPRSEYLKRTGVNVSDASVKGALPPMFKY